MRSLVWVLGIGVVIIRGIVAGGGDEAEVGVGGTGLGMGVAKGVSYM